MADRETKKEAIMMTIQVVIGLVTFLLGYMLNNIQETIKENNERAIQEVRELEWRIEQKLNIERASIEKIRDYMYVNAKEGKVK